MLATKKEFLLKSALSYERYLCRGLYFVTILVKNSKSFIISLNTFSSPVLGFFNLSVRHHLFYYLQ